MQMIRKESRLAMAQFRRKISSSHGSALANASRNAVAEQSQATSQSTAQQRRHLQNVTIASSTAPQMNPYVLSTMFREGSVKEKAGQLFTQSPDTEIMELTSKHVGTIAAARLLNDGKQIEIAFGNGDKYIFHAAWLKDSAAENYGGSFNRNSPHDFGRALGSTANDVCVEDFGSKLRVAFDVDGTACVHEYEKEWLEAFAPYVAEAIRGSNKPIENHGHLLGGLTKAAYQSPSSCWGSEKVFEKFDCQELCEDIDMQIRFLEKMATDGAAVILNVPAPSDLSSDSIGHSLERVVNQVVGAMYDPPRRKTNFGIMRANMAALNIGDEQALADYNFSNPLAMHTDHAIYEGTPGYLQFNWQAQGSVTTKVCNGISVAEYIRATNPRAFELLTTVHVTHAVRTNHYTFDGQYANSPGNYHEGTFEQAHTHPLIVLDSDKRVVQVIHNELKRGVSAIPFNIYEEFNEAYTLFKDLCEDPRFTCEVDWPEHSCVVLNNHFVLHGRATPVPGCKSERIMVWGYTRKDNTEMRYRLLQQRRLEVEKGISDECTRPVPNQVLMSM